MRELVFVSSVQKEFADDRKAIARHVRADPLLKRFFDLFLFEELPPRDRRADDIYLKKVDEASVYLGLFGDEYGSEEAAGISPTECEFDRATARGITRMIFVKGDDDAGRHPKMASLVRKAAEQLVRRRFGSIDELLQLLNESLVDYLAGRGAIQAGSFEERPCPGATLDDIDPDRVARFVWRARTERRLRLPEQTPPSDVLTHLHLRDGGQPSIAAILLFGRDPQRSVPAAELRCMHFHGTEVERPAPSYQVFKGSLFDQVDQGADFVLSKLNRAVGTRKHGPQAPVTYEIPPDVVREAIVNAVAHRDYASRAAVQVSVFADRVEVWNPGELPPELTPARLREPHPSVARNARICEALFLTRYIEKFGTGTLMMIRLCAEGGLPEPEFAQRGGEFVVTLWRDWLTDAVVERLGLNDRQRAAIAFLKQHNRLTNRAYQKLMGVTDRTALRDLEELLKRDVLRKVGTVGRGTYYVLRRQTRRKPDKPDASVVPAKTRRKPDKPDNQVGRRSEGGARSNGTQRGQSAHPPRSRRKGRQPIRPARRRKPGGPGK